MEIALVKLFIVPAAITFGVLTAVVIAATPVTGKIIGIHPFPPISFPVRIEL